MIQTPLLQLVDRAGRGKRAGAEPVQPPIDLPFNLGRVLEPFFFTKLARAFAVWQKDTDGAPADRHSIQVFDLRGAPQGSESLHQAWLLPDVARALGKSTPKLLGDLPDEVAPRIANVIFTGAGNCPP